MPTNHPKQAPKNCKAQCSKEPPRGPYADAVQLSLAGNSFALCVLAFISFVCLPDNSSPPPLQFFLTTFVAMVVLNAIVFQILVSDKQWKAAQDQRRVMDDTLDEMKTSRRLAHAPFVGCADIEPQKLRIGKLEEYSILIRNTGTTPACNVEVTLDRCFVKRGTDFTLPKPQYQTDPHGTLISNATSPVRFLIDEIDGPQMNSIVFRHETFYLWGTITYTDIFGKTHWTNFGFYYWPTNGGYLRTPNWNDCDYQYKGGQKPD